MRFSDISTRLYTAIFFTAIVIGGLMIHEWTYFLLLLLISVFCGIELMKILSGEKQNVLIFQVLLFCASPIVVAMMVQKGYLTDDSIFWVTIISACLFLFMASLLFSVNTNIITKTSQGLFGMMYIGIPCLLAYRLGYVQGTFSYLPLLGIIPLIWANDTGAYLVGSAIGRRPLFPAVSPKKTIEGTLGGILLTIAAAYPLSLLNNAFTWPQWSIIAAITGITATMGDLVESKIKRQYNIKDTGNYLPGHGGFLDRFDSFLYVVVFVYLYIQIS